MLRVLLVLFVLNAMFVDGFSQSTDEDSYRIDISIDEWKDTVAYLGYYVGAKTYLEDTATVVNNRVVFEGNKKLTSGMYFLYTPQSLFFEFLVNEQNFSMSTVYDDITGKMRVGGSPENNLFFEYQRELGARQKLAQELSDQFKNSTGADSIAILDRLRAINVEVKEYQQQARDNAPGTFFAEILSLILRPDTEEAPASLSEDEQKEYQFRKYKQQFWKGSRFENPGTIKNPLFETKVNEYFDKLVYQQADSINTALDQFLSVDMDTAVYRYLIVTLTNKYATSKMMGMDGVYVHMIDNYYSTGKAFWIDETTLTRMEQNSERLKPILIGQQAPLFRSENVEGQTIANPFSITDKDYKVLFFYDSGCGHCKKAAPKLMDAFHELQSADISVDVISMNLSDNKDEWKSFIDTYGLEGQILGDLKGVSNAGYYYYVDSTPKIFILDEKNKIIAKKLGAEFIDDFIKDYDAQLE